MGTAYQNLGEFAKALDCQKKALKIHEKNGNRIAEATDLGNIGFIYLEAPDSVLIANGTDLKKRYLEAMDFQNKALRIAEENQALDLQKEMWRQISSAFEKQENYAQAYQSFRKYIEIRDKIIGEENQKEITRKELQYTFEKKENEYRLIQTGNEKKLKEQEIIALRQNQELERNRQQLILAQKEKDLQELNYLRKQAELEKEKSDKENQLAIMEKNKQLQTSLLKTLEQERTLQRVEIERKRMERNGFLIATSLFVILSIVIFFSYRRQRSSNRELDRANKVLKETQQQLVQQEKLASLGQLTAGIAHEIKNPLNFVNNFAELSGELIAEIKESSDHEDREELLGMLSQNLEKIAEHGKRADRIVKNMLEHSRSGHAEKTPTDINKLADEYLNLSFHGFRAATHQFTCQIHRNLDQSIGMIPLVAQDFSRVLLNMFNNAFYAVHEKSKSGISDYIPEVNLSTKKEGDKIYVKVKDNGKGMPPDVLQKIFEPFFTTKPTGEGTGLGLSISFDIIKAHGGTVQVESEPGKFTSFTIILPA
jgi:signal transduction histidine kinase